jgi:hypothetical protein
MKLVPTLVLLAAAANAPAAELIVTLSDGMIGARVESLEYPQSLQKEITSGLTNRLYLRTALLDSGVVLAQQNVELSIRYDLWDEKFAVDMSLEGTTVETRVLSSLAETNAALSRLVLPRLFDSSGLPRTREIVLRVEALLNPIDRERMRMVQKWVAQNSTPQLGADSGTSVSNALFNRIFEQYANGADAAAAWHTEVSSPPFRIGALKADSH